MSSNIGRSLGRQANIFINYRREDTAGHAGRLFDRLSGRFPGRVFMDIDTIEPGIDFVDIIEAAVGCCEVLIVMIGRDWLTLADATGRRRLDNPSDFVRLEVATALERDIRIIPVLVEDAIMPRPEDLPPELALLTRRNAIELSDGRWSFDVDRLIQTIEGVLQDKAPSALMPVTTLQEAPAATPPPPEPAPPKARPQAWLAAALVALALVGWGAWRFGRQQTSQVLQAPQKIGETAVSQSLVTSPPAPEIQQEPAASSAPLESQREAAAPPASPKKKVTRTPPAAPTVQEPQPESPGRLKSLVRRGKKLIKKGLGRNQ